MMVRLAKGKPLPTLQTPEPTPTAHLPHPAELCLNNSKGHPTLSGKKKKLRKADRDTDTLQAGVQLRRAFVRITHFNNCTGQRKKRHMFLRSPAKCLLNENQISGRLLCWSAVQSVSPVMFLSTQAVPARTFLCTNCDGK